MGPGYQTRGMVADSQRWVNMYLEKVESGDDAAPGQKFCARLSPGKKIFCSLGAPIACVADSKASFYDPNIYLFFVMSGATLYGIKATFAGDVDTGTWTGTGTAIGTFDQKIIQTTGGQLFPAQVIVISPVLLFVVANGKAWVAGFGDPLGSNALGAATGSGGAGYAVGDTFTVDGGVIPAQGVVNTVDGTTGAVLTYTITYNGVGYSVGTGVTTTAAGAQPGAGSGFSIDITSVGGAQWVIQQQTIPFGSAGDYINSATWMDSYVIISMAPNATDPLRRQFFISGVNDPTTWSPLDFGTKEANSDPIMAVFAAYEILILFGSQTIELWQDTGQQLQTFQRVPGGGVIQNGLAETWAVAKMDNTVAWIGRDERGQYTAWSLQGVTPVRISNHAVENAWANYNVAGMSCYSYSANGHFFLVVHFPIPDKTWVYDSTIGPQLGWHERASASGSTLHADKGRYYGFFPESLAIVGDYSNGNLYVQDQRYYDENGTGIPRIRSSPHVATGLNWNYFDLYRLHCTQGSAPSGNTPTCNLEVSNDGGNTYGSLQTRNIGNTGQFTNMIEWRRQGRGRNRVVRWTMNEPMDFVLIDLYADVSPGSG